MLESRSAHGYFGSAGGYTGEAVPVGWGCIERRMSYYQYKTRYPKCKTLKDYDKKTKTITVLIPEEYTKRPNFGKNYTMNTFYFSCSPAQSYDEGIVKCRAKNYQNALRNVKRWAKSQGKTITGDAPGYENQVNM